MATRAAAIAVNRFGLGARSGELDLASQDPKDWLAQQLKTPAMRPPGALRTGGELLADFRPRAERPRPEQAQAALQQAVERGREVLGREAPARLQLAIATPTSFRERLVWFWSNHFTVSGAGKPRVLPLAGAFEREAIRPRVTGRFRDLLGAAMRHPGMLVYLVTREEPRKGASGKGFRGGLKYSNSPGFVVAGGKSLRFARRGALAIHIRAAV